ncbi:hypothetical protein FISHEDRAFT_32281 [Fistulina hepatica ATCC 64428]|uniref:ABM domain-containing protein n=1 Tax=Fistulina hepatica ATCC 64428 TaxID=1128425 RepID=A0A0D7ARL1_9AGAR|nr:hypothetical protein FISHEDRAFT_32281 [Fistulina hepatica ATCC 64428]
MSVVEIALLRAFKPVETAMQLLLRDLPYLKPVLEQAAGSPFFFLRCSEDPACVYVLSQWPSIEAHERFMKTPESAELLETFSDVGEFMWRFYLSCELEDLPLDVPVVSIARHFVTERRKREFEQTFQRSKKPLQEFTAPRKVACGWRIDKDGTRKDDEWVVFTGWDRVGQQTEFAQSPGFQEYARLRDVSRKYEARHVMKLQLPTP